MLINLRNALTAGKRLPYDAEVEYLGMTGGQYINTGVIGSSATKVEITAYSPNTSNSMALFGARNANNGNRPSYSIWRRASVAGGTRMRFDYNSASADSLAAGDWDASTVNTITKDNASNYVNGTLASVNTAHSFSLDIPFYLGTINNSGTPTTYYFVGRVYSCRIWDANNVLVRDLIPVRVGTTGEMYDRVSGTFMERHGDFVVGQDVVPVEYIESHGTEYIDTGVSATGATNSEFQFKMSVVGFAFGARTAWNTSAYSLNYIGGNYAFNYGNKSSAADLGTTIPIDTNWHTAKIQSGGVLSLDGWTNTVGAYSFTTSGSLILFGTRQSSSLNQTASGFKYCKIWESSTPIRSFLAVRVGTEGALIDTLTRRIYRNQGTGAFGYGNDLPYPIPAS